MANQTSVKVHPRRQDSIPRRALDSFSPQLRDDSFHGQTPPVPAGSPDPRRPPPRDTFLPFSDIQRFTRRQPVAGLQNSDPADISSIVPSPLRIRKLRSISPTHSPARMKTVRLLIASLGNPAPYHSTRHSAGHIILKGLVGSLHFPAVSKSKELGNGMVSHGTDLGRPEYTLWQSTSMMNVSGPGLLKAWKAFDGRQADQDVVTALLVLHDELESSPGTVKLRRGESSPKGHNGIKSVQSSFKSASILNALGDRFIKIGIGIGRPVSRERDDVSAFVLGQVTASERQKLDAGVQSVAAVIESEISRLEKS